MGVFIIAEIGINHNGDIDIAKKLIDIAKEAGCDAVKFQKRDINLVYSKEMLDSPRESPWGHTQREQKLGLEFGREEYDEIDRYCREKDILWSASAWEMHSLEFLDRYDLKIAKVASAMMVSEEFLQAVARRGKKTFMSTAMCTMDDIARAISIFEKENCPFELMHCVACYPLAPENANLKCIHTLRDTFHCPVGYSGHEMDGIVSLAAVGMGATSIERHITLDRTMYGSDQKASLEPGELKTFCRNIRLVESALGDGSKKILEPELNTAKKLRAHIHG